MELMARAIVAVTFLFAVILKVRSLRSWTEFVRSFGDWGVTREQAQRTGAVVVLIAEGAAVVAAVLLPSWGQVPGGLLLTAMAIGLIRLRLRGVKECRCFGSTAAGPMVEHIVINVVFVALCVVALGGFWRSSSAGTEVLQIAIGVGIALCQFVPAATQRLLLTRSA